MDDQTARQLLEEERRRLMDLEETFELTNVQSESEQDGVDELSSVDQHPGDLGTETFEREKRLSILASVQVQLADVKRAFEHLENGRYGRCESCGNPISDERLEARPAARYCLEHQAEVEERVASAGSAGSEI